MEASVTDAEGSTELCEIMDEEDFHYRMMFTPQMEGTHTLSIKHKGLHISGTVSRFLFYLVYFFIRKGSYLSYNEHKIIFASPFSHFGRLLRYMSFYSTFQAVHLSTPLVSWLQEAPTRYRSEAQEQRREKLASVVSIMTILALPYYVTKKEFNIHVDFLPISDQVFSSFDSFCMF